MIVTPARARRDAGTVGMDQHVVIIAAKRADIRAPIQMAPVPMAVSGDGEEPTATASALKTV